MNGRETVAHRRPDGQRTSLPSVLVSRRRAVLIPAALALVVAACGGSSSDSGDDAAAAPAASAPSEAADRTTAAPEPAEEAGAVPAALQFTAPLVGGGELDAATLADKPTVFWFWAPT